LAIERDIALTLAGLPFLAGELTRMPSADDPNLVVAVPTLRAFHYSL
jgi:hypothetical protein